MLDPATEMSGSNIKNHIINRRVPRVYDPSKDNIVMIIEKKTTLEEDEFYECPYY